MLTKDTIASMRVDLTFAISGGHRDVQGELDFALESCGGPYPLCMFGKQGRGCGRGRGAK